jgi:hypothetical protein
VGDHLRRPRSPRSRRGRPPGGGWTRCAGRPARTGGGFETLAQATLLLAGYETPAAVFLAGTWLPDLGIRPVFGVMGGTITYTDAAWTVEWNPAPIGVTGTPPPAVTWDDLDPSLVWDDAPNPNAFHDSVTYEDLAFVSSGSITNGA